MSKNLSGAANTLQQAVRAVGGPVVHVSSGPEHDDPAGNAHGLGGNP